MNDVRTGRQEPTISYALPYTETDGQLAVDLYEMTGHTAMDWQKALCYDILAKNADGLWVHTRFGYSVPRRNGKGEIIIMRELYGLATGEPEEQDRDGAGTSGTVMRPADRIHGGRDPKRRGEPEGDL